MIELVLDDPGAKSLGLDLQLVAASVLCAHAHAQRPLDIDVHAGQAEAALFGHLQLLARPLQRRIHERDERIVRISAVDEHSVQDPELRGGEPDSKRVVHELAHAIDLLLQHGVEALDGQRAGAQRGVAELAHFAQRRVAARASLGIELGRRRCAGLALDLHVGIVGARAGWLLRELL